MYNKFLESDKIYLREVRETDVDDNYYSWLNDPEINQYLETRFYPRSKTDIQKFIQKMDGNPNEILFAICCKENDKHIGNIKLGPINWIHRKGDISLVIGDKNYWGKGYATEAIQLIVRFAFLELNLNKVIAGYYEGNKGSEKAFKKCGFMYEGTFKAEYYYQGKFVDVVRTGLFRNNYNIKNNKK